MQDGNLAAQALEEARMKADSLKGETHGCIILDFARPAVRPASPIPPECEADVQEKTHLWIWWASEVTQPPDNVDAWALFVKDLKMGNWYVVDGASGEAHPVDPRAQYAGFLPQVVEVCVKVGLPAGRRYSACVACRTVHGWSTLSELSVPTMLHKTYLPVEPDIIVQSALNPERMGCVFFSAPMDLVPMSSAPIALRSGPDSCGGERRVLRFDKVLRDSCDTVAMGRSATGRLALVTRTSGRVAESSSLHLHGTRLVLNLETGDAVTTANGVTNVDGIIDEFRRRPQVMALRFQRLIGPSKRGGNSDARLEQDYADAGNLCYNTVLDVPQEMSREGIMRIEEALDERISPLAEEIQLHEHMRAEDGALVYSLLEFDAERLAYLSKLVEAADPSNISPDLLKESEKRLFFLNQRKNALKQENPILRLKYAVCDSKSDPKQLNNAMNRFARLPLGVRGSRLGKQLISRATALQRLWEWRIEAKQLRSKLHAAVQDAQDREFEPDEIQPEGLDSQQLQVLMWSLAKTKYDSKLLERLLVEIQPYICMMGFDNAAAKAAVQRLQGKLAKRKAQIFKVDALLLEMESGPKAAEDSDDDAY
jgi:hypothetical protein